ncbi:DNA-directed RNA polymerase beta' subunit [Vibrio ishigakensis]|uniref:DNA-directed RNA polymerase beta' subunit n=1 Tax=Vibrio ishigakensis TaxID=1481914 RepID=A0A0B8QMU9_9VIBR|nr:DNA-directed RNA polymerase beta' subunit [Vibrio ishigakensis]
MKDLLNFLKAQHKTEEFDAIKIGLSSPDMIRSWSFGEVKSLRQSTIVRSNLSAMVCSVRVSLAQLKTTSVFVANISV